MSFLALNSLSKSTVLELFVVDSSSQPLCHTSMVSNTSLEKPFKRLAISSRFLFFLLLVVAVVAVVAVFLVVAST